MKSCGVGDYGMLAGILVADPVVLPNGETRRNESSRNVFPLPMQALERVFAR
jgi:hypothetical protein